MTSELLLTHGYCLAADPHEAKVMKPYAPLGLLYLTAYLKSRGHAVDVFDATFATPEGLSAQVSVHPAPVVGIYTNLMTRGPVLALIATAKAAGKTVVLGGPESAGYPEHYIEAGADVVVFGEGEAALHELLAVLPARGPHRLSEVPGVAFRNEMGHVVTTAPRPAISDLDSLPWPDRHAIPLEPYFEAWRSHHGAASVSLITARGCPYRCRWCSHAVFGYTHRRRSPADVAAELATVVADFDPDMAWYADDVFTIHPRWLGQYAAELARRNLTLPFETITRADRVTPEVVANLARMGCFRIWLGAESGSQRILDAMERGVTLDQVRGAARQLKAAGIQVGMFLMWGYPGESESDIEATIELVKDCDPDIFLTTVAYPIQSTPYFVDVADSVVAPDDWAAATDRDYRIRGRHSPRYYRHATRRLRHAVNAHRLAGGGARQALGRLKAQVGAATARLGMHLTRSEAEA